MCDSGSEGSVKASPISLNGIVGGGIGWELCGSVNRGPIDDNLVGGVLGVVLGSDICVGVSHNNIAGVRIGWELCGSVNRGSIEDNRVGGVLGGVLRAVVCVGVIRWKHNARQ